MKKIVITGATSMIGTALTEIAARAGIEVYSIIRPDTKRADRIINSDNVHVVYGALGNLKDVKGIPNDCDVFYHFAWAGTSKKDRNNPVVQERNIKYTLDAVCLAEKTGCRKFVGAGSQAEYGPTTDIINHNTKYDPTTSYGASKLAACILSRNICEQKGISHIWARIFSVYGPHDNEGTMLNYVLDCWRRGEVAQLSSGQQMWNYIYESDAGQLFFEMGKESVEAGTYLVANPESRPLREYVEIMMRTYGENAKTSFAPVSSAVLPGLNVMVDNTFEVLGYRPHVCFDEGIKTIIKKSKL